MGWFGDRSVRKAAIEAEAQEAYTQRLYNEALDAWEKREPKVGRRDRHSSEAIAFATGYVINSASQKWEDSPINSRGRKMALEAERVARVNALDYLVTPFDLKGEQHRNKPDLLRGMGAAKEDGVRRKATSQR